jgi:hypothetical protein
MQEELESYRYYCYDLFLLMILTVLDHHLYDGDDLVERDYYYLTLILLGYLSLLMVIVDFELLW